MKKFLVGMAIFSSFIYADCSSGGCYDVEITRIFATDAGVIWVTPSGDVSQLNCTPAGNTSLTLEDTAGKNAIYSFLLTQMTTKKHVNLRVHEGTNGCSIAYAY